MKNVSDHNNTAISTPPPARHQATKQNSTDKQVANRHDAILKKLDVQHQKAQFGRKSRND